MASYKDVLEKCEKVLFIGTYDVNNNNVQNDGITSTLPANITKGHDTLTVYAYNVNTIVEPNIPWLNETYTVSSYNSDFTKKYGQLTWVGFYPNNGDVTDGGIKVFPAYAGIGKYSKIIKVIIDFSQDIRKMYFVGCR